MATSLCLFFVASNNKVYAAEIGYKYAVDELVKFETNSFNINYVNANHNFPSALTVDTDLAFRSERTITFDTENLPIYYRDNVGYKVFTALYHCDMVDTPTDIYVLFNKAYLGCVDFGNWQSIYILGDYTNTTYGPRISNYYIAYNGGSNIVPLGISQYDGEKFVINIEIPLDFVNHSAEIKKFGGGYRLKTTIGYQSSELFGKVGHAMDFTIFTNNIPLYGMFSSKSDWLGGYNQGYTEGKDNGYILGKEDGIKIGYNNGLKDGGANNLSGVIPSALGSIGDFFVKIFSYDIFGVSLFSIFGTIGAILLAIWLIKMAKGG